jgi:4-hydroxy-3-methylbut-2-enyl diphosphate reductase
MAEKESKKGNKLYCLGEIVHNAEEINRLKSLGIEFIDRAKYFTLSACKVMIRAHGEPPETYKYAKENNIELIDATCPVVLRLQDRIRVAQSMNPSAQIVIYGKHDHPEVIGLRGQVENTIIVESIDDLIHIDYGKPVSLFAQTTKDKSTYADICSRISKGLVKAGLKNNDLVIYNSICGQVANRAPWLAEFSKTVDALILVGGKNSSNSKMLFEVCRQNNPNSFFVTKPDELINFQLNHYSKIGITGATSTPLWLIEAVADRIRENV